MWVKLSNRSASCRKERRIVTTGTSARPSMEWKPERTPFFSTLSKLTDPPLYFGIHVRASWWIFFRTWKELHFAGAGIYGSSIPLLLLLRRGPFGPTRSLLDQIIAGLFWAPGGQKIVVPFWPSTPVWKTCSEKHTSFGSIFSLIFAECRQLWETVTFLAHNRRNIQPQFPAKFIKKLQEMVSQAFQFSNFYGGACPRTPLGVLRLRRGWKLPYKIPASAPAPFAKWLRAPPPPPPQFFRVCYGPGSVKR